MSSTWRAHSLTLRCDTQLTHNVHGPHDASFYKLLEKLEEEYYELKRKGYSGASTPLSRLHLS